ncbi:hypothetical protein ES703_14522 [subsurface metagenome]
MTDFGRRCGLGDMLKSVYDSNEDGVIAVAQTQADMTKAVYDSNEDGVIAVAQTEADMTKAVYDSIIGALVALAADHSAQHESGGSDALNVTGLTGTTPRALLGDAHSGRVLRELRLAIDDGTNANTLKCTLSDRWNSTNQSAVDNISKGTTTGGFFLSGTGQQLVIGSAILEGLPRMAIGVTHKNNNTADTTPAIVSSTDSILVYLFHVTGGTMFDMTDFADNGLIHLNILYITDA